jgi:hypothetical protein
MFLYWLICIGALPGNHDYQYSSPSQQLFTRTPGWKCLSCLNFPIPLSCQEWKLLRASSEHQGQFCLFNGSFRRTSYLPKTLKASEELRVSVKYFLYIFLKGNNKFIQ